MFEWDEIKRQINIEKHGVDFRLAAGIFLGPVLEAVDDREDYAETRFRALGKVGDICFIVIYTRRGETRGLISAWKAGRNEQERYENLFRE